MVLKQLVVEGLGSPLDAVARVSEPSAWNHEL